MISSSVKLGYDPNDPLNGAFTYLQKVFGRSDINNGIVKINASSTVQNLYNPVVIRDFTDNLCWYSSSVNGSWYEVDFLQNDFYLKSYIIRDYYWDFFEKWQVLGSNDGVHFDVVDDVTNFAQPSTGLHNIHFVCKYPKMRRIFRVVANGKRFYGDYAFVIHRLEFYGMITSSIRGLCGTCRCRNHLRSTLDLSIILLCS
jgi:hypothetical protein